MRDGKPNEGARALLQDFQRVKPLDQPVTVYHFSTRKEADLERPGFTSASMTALKGSYDFGEYAIAINVPAGTRVLRGNLGELEVILPPMALRPTGTTYIKSSVPLTSGRNPLMSDERRFPLYELTSPTEPT
jgi:hypothetical protein